VTTTRKLPGLKLVAAMARSGELDFYVRNASALPLLAVGETERRAFEYVAAFVSRHGKIPSAATVERDLRQRLPATEEPPSYYLDGLQKRRLHGELRDAAEEANRYLTAEEYDPRRALSVLSDAVGRLSREQQAGRIVDYREAGDAILGAYAAAATGERVGVDLGWPTLDGQQGGAGPGDLVSIAGRPAVGKTWLVVSAAMHLWRTGGSPLLVSMEMRPSLILRRIAALDAGVPARELRLGKLSQAGSSDIAGDRERLEESLRRAADVEQPFWVVDGNLAIQVQDLVLLARQLKPSAVYVDGAYMMRHPDPRLSRFRRVDEVCEQLKRDLAEGCDLPVIASWQFNREADRKMHRARPGSDATASVGLDDIAHSDEIGKLSSVVLALFQEDTPETIEEKTVAIRKGREGEQGRFRIRWNFKRMRFDEIDDLEAPEGDEEIDPEVLG